MYQNALYIRKRQLGYQHPDTNSCLFYIGHVFEEVKKFPEAIATYICFLDQLKLTDDPIEDNVDIMYVYKRPTEMVLPRNDVDVMKKFLILMK